MLKNFNYFGEKENNLNLPITSKNDFKNPIKMYNRYKTFTFPLALDPKLKWQSVGGKLIVHVLPIIVNKLLINIPEFSVYQHVASNIVEHEIRHKEILQSSFDLLGELVKFNIDAFKTFDTILTTQEKVSQ